MKTSRQVSFLVVQILAIATGLMYVLSCASDLINEKDDLMNIAGFAVIIAVLGLTILGVTHYAEEFGEIFKKEKPDAAEAPQQEATATPPSGIPNPDGHNAEGLPVTTQPTKTTTKGTPDE